MTQCLVEFVFGNLGLGDFEPEQETRGGGRIAGGDGSVQKENPEIRPGGYLLSIRKSVVELILRQPQRPALTSLVNLYLMPTLERRGCLDNWRIRQLIFAIVGI